MPPARVRLWPWMSLLEWEYPCAAANPAMRDPALDLAGGPMQTVIAGTSEIELHMREFQANVMPSTFVPAAGPYTGTWVWGYIAGAGVPTSLQGARTSDR